MKLKTRLIYANVGIVLLAALVNLGYMLFKTWQVTDNNNIKKMELKAENVSNNIGNILRNAEADAVNLADIAKSMVAKNKGDRELLNEIMKQLLTEKENYTYVWCAWEPNSFDGEDSSWRNKEGSDSSGRYIPAWIRDGEKINLGICTDLGAEYYTIPKSTKEMYITDPTTYEQNGESFRTVTFSVPVIDNGRFLGVVGVDISTERLDEINRNLDLEEVQGYGRLVKGSGLTIAHKDSSMRDTMIDENEKKNYEKVFSGKSFYDRKTKINGKRSVTFFAPIEFQKHDDIWGYSIVVDEISFNKDMINLIIFLLCIAAFAVLLMLFIVIKNGKYVTDGIKAIQENIAKLASYDLREDKNISIEKYSKKKDEIGDISREALVMKENFVQLVKRVSQNTEKVESSSRNLTSIAQESAEISEEVSKAMGEISGGAMEQANQAEIGTIGIQELGELVNSNRNEMLNVKAVAEDVTESVTDGLKAVKTLTEDTERSNIAVAEIAEIIHKTDESSEKINSASEIIASIAEKTNLLSLNAAIEAARAGDAGRGFVVVAEEIKGLAMQSAESTKEIYAMVEQLRINTKTTVERMNNVLQMTQNQKKSVKFTEEKYLQIETRVKAAEKAIDIMEGSIDSMQSEKDKVVDVISSLASIAQENASGVEEVTASVEVQSNSAERIAKTCGELNTLSKELKENVDKFKM